MGPRKRPISEDTKTKDSISNIYPHINEKRTPLPRYWSHEDKCEHLGLSNRNLIVTYKGQGVDKNHKDAGSVRTAHPIPTGVGIYYFEIFVHSKGRDGYMGIGISPHSQSNLNRLPGWDKDSYGYHGDDGNSFCSKGSGQPYGPTFTTGDTVGCGINFVERTCFFTKNGINLGPVVTDLPLRSFYPTVGLQTPGETVEANFGQKPFVFDLSDFKFEAKYFINKTVSSRAIERNHLHSLVSSYLIHRGYNKSAYALAKQTGMAVSEGMQSIENRRFLEKLITEGNISEALTETEKRYPSLLSDNIKLEFLLKCRQFVELVASGSNNNCQESNRIQSNGDINGSSENSVAPESESRNQIDVNGERLQISATGIPPSVSNGSESNGIAVMSNDVVLPEAELSQRPESRLSEGPTEMDLDCNSCHANNAEANQNSYLDSQAASSSSNATNTNANAMSNEDSRIMEAILQGRKLRQLADKAIASGDCNSENIEQHLLEVFGLLAYEKPGESPLKHVLEPSYRESACNLLNGAILQSHNMAADPQLQTLLIQSATCLQEMTSLGMPEAAFVSMKDVVQ